MAYKFNYAVLFAVPDTGRGERVNVGIVVFHPDQLDIRLTELGKVRALTGYNWNEYANAFRGKLMGRYAPGGDAAAIIAEIRRIDPVFRASELAWFSIDDEATYETRIREIIDFLVTGPKPQKARTHRTRINTEIASSLKNLKLLARDDEPLESHKVKRDHLIEDELRADFVQQNGVIRVAATLDLRHGNADIRDATLKAIVLDRAKALYKSDAERLGIYAAIDVDDALIKQRIKLLAEYSTRTFNWEDAIERRRLMNLINVSAGRGGPLFAD